jgi:octaprenyl-diphosphate synthase
MTPFAAGSSPKPKHVFSGVFDLLEAHLAALDSYLAHELDEFEPEIRDMARYCLGASGKKIRPALVFLSGWRGTGAIDPNLVRAAAVVELIHLATLVHDDIMDQADLRRNRKTASRLYGSTAAVLLGDALFAHALNLATQFPTTEVCAAVSESTRRVCAGEIVQTLRRGSMAVNRSDYDRIIELKTAELFRVSCYLGARLAGSPAGYAEAVSRFGRHLGVAYQIYDDLVDYFGDETSSGKTLGTDLASGKVTLPLFALLDRLSAGEAESLRQEIGGHHPPQLELRLAQMTELGVLADVETAVVMELAAARAALAEWSGEPATVHLLGLGNLLTTQVAGLRH